MVTQLVDDHQFGIRIQDFRLLMTCLLSSTIPPLVIRRVVTTAYNVAFALSFPGPSSESRRQESVPC